MLNHSFPHNTTYKSKQLAQSQFSTYIQHINLNNLLNHSFPHNTTYKSKQLAQSQFST